MDAPLLSVCLITYNHAKYIRQAIDSVLMQEVDFSWELIIADDCSTDGTREIVLEYKNKYPDFIKLILQEKNVGATQNWLDLITLPKSKYIAYIEGDDYWICLDKLQKQIDILEQNHNIVLCHHAFDILNQDGRIHRNRNKINQQKIIRGFSDILNSSFPKSLTSVFRAEAIQKYNLSMLFKGIRTGDVLLWHLLLLNGDAYYINKIMGVYRSHDGGITNTFGFKQNTLAKILILERLIQNKIYNNPSFLREFIAKRYWVLYHKEESIERYHYFFLSFWNKIRSKYLWNSKELHIENPVKIHWYLSSLFK